MSLCLTGQCNVARCGRRYKKLICVTLMHLPVFNQCEFKQFFIRIDSARQAQTKRPGV